MGWGLGVSRYLEREHSECVGGTPGDYLDVGQGQQLQEWVAREEWEEGSMDGMEVGGGEHLLYS